MAALFVEKGGVYFGLPDVDPWDSRYGGGTSRTPVEFRDELLSIARTARQKVAA